MHYQIKDLQIYSTPKAESMFQFADLSSVEFDFPARLKTALFIHCGMVGGSYYEIVARLYSSHNPQESNEQHIGKLYVHVYDYPHATRYKTIIERFVWLPDGSHEVYDSDGKKIFPLTESVFQDKKKSSGCFIATAVYGSSYVDEVMVLRDFRDNWLLKYSLGNAFVKFYYWISPPIANQIAKSNYLRIVTKVVLILPLLKFANNLKTRRAKYVNN